jgi:hypothetical protein
LVKSDPPYEKTFSVVVRAKERPAARELALGFAGNEGRGTYRQFGYAEDQLAHKAWLDTAYRSASHSSTGGL